MLSVVAGNSACCCCFLCCVVCVCFEARASKSCLFTLHNNTATRSIVVVFVVVVVFLVCVQKQRKREKVNMCLVGRSLIGFNYLFIYLFIQSLLETTYLIWLFSFSFNCEDFCSYLQNVVCVARAAFSCACCYCWCLCSGKARS